MLFHYVYPEPDILNNGFIVYCSEEKVAAVARNHGIIIQAEEIDAANNDNREALIYSILVGTGVAFALDILVQLVREWRNVNRKDDKEKIRKNEHDTAEKNQENTQCEVEQQKTTEAIDMCKKDTFT